MLVISRKPKEWVQIGKNIRVCVAKVRGDRVYLGIEAPKETRIIREELNTKDQTDGMGTESH